MEFKNRIIDLLKCIDDVLDENEEDLTFLELSRYTNLYDSLLLMLNSIIIDNPPQSKALKLIVSNNNGSEKN